MSDNQEARPNKGGRPRKEGPLAKEHTVRVYFDTQEQADLVKAAARKNGQAVAAWARLRLLEAARQELEE